MNWQQSQFIGIVLVVSQRNSSHSKHSLTLFLNTQVVFAQNLFSFGTHPVSLLGDVPVTIRGYFSQAILHTPTFTGYYPLFSLPPSPNSRMCLFLIRKKIVTNLVWIHTDNYSSLNLGLRAYTAQGNPWETCLYHGDPLDFGLTVY